MMTKEEKINWLNRYLRSQQRQKQLAWELDELRAQAAGSGARMDGMPHGGAAGDRTARAVERLMRAQAALGAECRVGSRAAYEIETLIDAQEDPRVRMILDQRYLQGKSWDEVAAVLHLDKRWAQRVLASALVTLRVPEKRGRRGNGC